METKVTRKQTFKVESLMKNMSLRKYKRPLAKHNTCVYMNEAETKACRNKNRTIGGPPVDDNDIAKA